MELLKYLDAEADKLHEENFSSSDEFRTVNHSFVEGFNYALAIVQGFKIELNSNQQIVLEWLKEVYIDNDEGYFSVISYLTNPTTEEEVHDPAHIALACLNPDEEVQVLAAFAEWGKEKVMK